jgi:uncharacterized membrane protein
MRLRSLLAAGLFAAAAFSLGRALATRDGVGPIEYAAGIALVLVLCLSTLGAARRAFRRA